MSLQDQRRLPWLSPQVQQILSSGDYLWDLVLNVSWLLESAAETIAAVMMIEAPRAVIVLSSHIFVSPKNANQYILRVKI